MLSRSEVVRLRCHSKKDMLEKRGLGIQKSALRNNNMFRDDGHAHVWRAAGYQLQTLVDKVDEHAAILAYQIELCLCFKA